MPTTYSNGIELGGAKLTGLGDGTNATDAVNKGQLDAIAQGIKGVKDPVRVVSLVNVTVSSPGATHDGVTLANGNRILLAGQSTASENGIYVYNGASSALTRATDANQTGEIEDGTIVSPAEGTANVGWIYRQENTPSGAPGSWAQSWVKYQQGTAYSAGTAISVSGGVISVTTVPVANGGTGATSASGAKTNLGFVTRYAQTIGDGTNTSIVVTHNLGTVDVDINLQDVGSGREEMPDVTGRTTNSVTLAFYTAPATNSKRVTVQG